MNFPKRTLMATRSAMAILLQKKFFTLKSFLSENAMLFKLTQIPHTVARKRKLINGSSMIGI